MWTIEFHEKAKKEFDELSNEFKEKFEFIFKEVRLFGIRTISYKNSKHIGDGIWEFRVIGRSGIARSLYVTEAEQTVKILTAFIKKTEKTPADKIEIAKKRRRE